MLTVACLALGSGQVFGSSPAFWEMSSYTEFLKGKFHQVALNRGGSLVAAPSLEPFFSSGQSYLWSLARAQDGTIYAGTGNQGRLFRITPDGKGQVLWTAPQPEIFAVAAAPGGIVYAGTSPNGKIYRIENGSATEFFAPKATYIWTLAIGRDGALYAGTGAEGKVYRITAPGQGEEYFATGQANVTGLQFAADGTLLAGTEPNGVLYRITGKGKAFALYDSNLPEIRAMAEAPDGTIYAAGLGGALAKKAQSAAQAVTAATGDAGTVTTSITVTANEATGEFKPPEPAKPAAPAAVATATTTATTPSVEVTGLERSALYAIHPDNTVESLWSSKEENIYDLLATKTGLLFVTDLGRIYRLDSEQHLALIAQTGEGDLARLFDIGTRVLAAAGTGGKIFQLGTSAAATGGTYESPVFDAGSVARWGHLRRAGSGTISLWTRSGNSLRPDRTWTDWLPVKPDEAIASAPARYLAWKAELTGNASVTSVTAGYLPQNNSPVVRSITALTTLQPAAAPIKTANGSGAATTSYSITVTDTGDAGPSTSTGTPTQTLSRAASQQLILSWQAEDPDGDRLVYEVAFRGESEQGWKTLRGNLHENTLTLDAESLADGRYWFRVTASDHEMNASGTARRAELISSPVLIDNTAPEISAGPVRNGEFEWRAADRTSALKRAEYAVDGGSWIPLDPVEGILDSKEARFHVQLPKLPPGDHVIVLRALDLANNSAQYKLTLP